MNIDLTINEQQLIKEALTDLQSELVGVGTKTNNIIGILNKLKPSTSKVKKSLVNKEYMFTFESGGWNTVWAKTKKGAIKAAVKEYEGIDNLTVKVDSVHKATESGLKSAMGLFY